MATGNPSLIVKVGANIETLKAALALSQTELIKTAAGAKALGSSLSGNKLEQNALQMAVAIKSVGGATTLTAAEAKKADAAFQAWFEKAAKTGKEIPPELAKIAAETKKVADETKKAEEGAGGFFAKLAGGVTVGNLVASALTSIGSAAMSAVSSAAMALPNMISNAIELGGQLFDMSLKTGASVENLSRLRFVSSQTGISMETFTNSMYKMQVALGGSGEKAKTTAQALSKLGLDMNVLKNQKPDEAFIAIMSGLEKIPNRADQARIGMELFSKGFKDMAGLTQESISDLMAQADEFGLVYSTEFASAADIAGDAIERLKLQWEAITIRIGAAFLPAVIGIVDTFSGAFRDAVNGANESLGKMGGPSGFLSTVAKAMGQGDEALAAQVALYETLRDVIIGVIRGAVMPLITGFSNLMILVNAAKVVWGDLVQVVNLLALGFKVLALGVAEVGNFLSRGKLWGDDVKRIKGELDGMVKKIDEQGAAIKRAKDNQEWWSNTAKETNAMIESALQKVENKHVDIAKIIKDNAAVAKAAAGSTGAAIEEESKKLDGLNDSAKQLTTTFETLTKQGASGKVIFEALGSDADGMREKFAALGLQVPADLQKVIDKIQALGMEIKIAKWMEQQRADVRKVLEDMAKDTEALASRQREALNKAYVGNLDVQIKASKDLENLEADSLEKRLDLVRKDMESRRQALDENASNYESSLAVIDDLEEKSARNATEAWLDHVAEMKKMLGPSFLDIFRSALEGIPDIITAAFTGGGGIGGAISGILSDLGGQLGEKLGGMLARALDGPLGKLGAKVGGAIFDMIPGIGGALGSMIMPALDKAWGWISKREGRQVNDLRDAYVSAAGGFEKLAEQARKAGVELSSSSAFQRAKTVEEWNKAVADLDAKLKKVAADRQKLLADVIAGERLATKELLDEMATMAKGSADAAKQSADYYRATLGQAASGLTQMFAGLEASALKTDERLLASKKKALESATGAQKDALQKEIALLERSAKEGLQVFIGSQAQAAGLAGAIAGTFGKLRENGASFREALSAIKGPLDSLRKQLEMTGYSGGAAFENLSRLGQAATDEITGPLFDAIDGANQALMGLHNSGLLNQESFAALAETATDAYDQIIAQGVEGDVALQMMQPTLQTIWELQQQFGYTVDENTQALLDQAVAAGMVGEQQMDAQERTARAMEKVAGIMEAIARKMGVDLPAAAESGARRIEDAFGRIDPSIPEPWDGWGPPPEFDFPTGEFPEPTGYASGGVVYAASGWTPRGTDIVPAMLTPGERVLTVAQNREYERTRGESSSTSPMNVNITIQAMDPVGLKKVVETEVAPLLVSVYRRNVNGLRTDTRRELVE